MSVIACVTYVSCHVEVKHVSSEGCEASHSYLLVSHCTCNVSCHVEVKHVKVKVVRPHILTYLFHIARVT